MSTRNIGEILEDMQNSNDTQVRMLAKELTNASGSHITRVREAILGEAFAEAVKMDDTEEEYVPLSTLQNIIRTAGDRL